MNRILVSFIVLGAAVLSVSAQTRTTTYSDMIAKRCSDNKTYFASVIMQSTGETIATPCPGKANVLNGSTVIRRNSSDFTAYADSLDISSEFSTTETWGQNFSSTFNINSTPFSPSSSYTNGIFSTTYNSPNRAGGVIGLIGNAVLLSNTPIHDIQGMHGEAIAVNGSAASGLYGGTFNVGVFGGTNHGNISDLTVGASTVRDSDVRNYFRLWLKRPTVLNATIRDGRNLQIYNEGPFGNEFQGFLLMNNSSVNSSGGTVTPLQIKVAADQSADAFSIRGADDLPTFALTASGQIRIVNPSTPPSSGATCAVGTISWDVNNIYVCVAENVWRKSQLSSF